MTYQNFSLRLPALAVLIAVGLSSGIAADEASAQQADDVSVNLDALGLNQALQAEDQPRLILKYPGSATATRQIPQLRYPSVPAPTARPTPPPAAKPEVVATKPAPSTTAMPAPAPAPAASAPKAIVATPVKPEPTEPAPVTDLKPVERKTESAATIPAPAPEPKAEPAPEAAQAPEPAAPAAPAPVTPAEITPPAPEPEAQVAALSPPAPVTELPDPDPAILRVIFDEQTAAIIGSARKDLDAIGESLRYDPRRIELKAYGGTPGDKASDARRISLKRGLAVRAYLIGLGIDSRRIDVRALGGVTDTGAPDRVDVAYSGT